MVEKTKDELLRVRPETWRRLSWVKAYLVQSGKDYTPTFDSAINYIYDKSGFKGGKQ